MFGTSWRCLIPFVGFRFADCKKEGINLRLSPYKASKARYPWKSQVENVLLGRKQHSFIYDFGLHLLLNPTAAQEMLDDAAVEGYTTPELSKMKDVSRESDIYNLGVILLELVTGKEPINRKEYLDQDFHLPMSMRNGILDHWMSDLYHPDVLMNEDDNVGLSPVNEGVILEFVQLGPRRESLEKSLSLIVRCCITMMIKERNKAKPNNGDDPILTVGFKIVALRAIIRSNIEVLNWHGMIDDLMGGNKWSDEFDYNMVMVDDGRYLGANDEEAKKKLKSKYLLFYLFKIER
ncbi:Protein kinase, catalytic domain-containing protein [Cynara cardunculus var. scolymus]|uniref:Protein kinase, catalytic domain-containing protein n=1 Tax=Cynara cardunculus var. scolymus TaxID=59895 RepID=A0A103Y7X3_CYNCS|nr:Protein kinase, catalytic domain-containing protein [Cynara cardunculus var. scolymus]